MRHFGRAKGGGRRRSPREPLPLPAVVSRIEQRQVALLLDFSSSGARLKGAQLPRPGEPVSLLIDCVRAFGTIAWSDQDMCGVAFDPPIPSFEVERLRREATAMLTFSTLADKVAGEVWARERVL